MPRSQPHTPDQTEVRHKASRYILEKFGDRLWAGQPAYDDRRARWTVPIHSRSLPAEVELGQMTLDAHGAIVRVPTRRALQRACSASRSPPRHL